MPELTDINMIPLRPVYSLPAMRGFPSPFAPYRMSFSYQGYPGKQLCSAHATGPRLFEGSTLHLGHGRDLGKQKMLRTSSPNQDKAKAS